MFHIILFFSFFIGIMLIFYLSLFFFFFSRPGKCARRQRSRSRRGCRNPRGNDMKEGIHPVYREVCFQDLSNGHKFVTRSCVQTKDTVKMDDGRELPLVKVEVTSETHPFYTGTQKSVDSLGGRVEKFRNKFARVGIKK